MTRSIIILLSVCALAGCSNNSDASKEETIQTAATNSASDSEMYVPIISSENDGAMMRAWYKHNELCQGSSDASTIDAICLKRDQTGTELERRGWCWTFLDKPSSESQWHRCAIEAPRVTKNPVEQDAAFFAGVAAGGTQENQQAVEAVQLSASSALRKYEELIKPLNMDIATANVVVGCGLRTNVWINQIRKRVTASFAADSSVASAKSALTEGELAVSVAYIKGVMTQHEKYHLGLGDDKHSGCEAIRTAPFLSRFDNYAAGLVDTLPDGEGAHSAAGSAAPTPIADLPGGVGQSDRSQLRQRQIDDARAMVRESWNSYGQTIESIQIGYKCEVVDNLSANVAVQRIQIMMQNELANAGLLDDPTMSIKQITEKFVGDGVEAVQHGACSHMTPAMRGRLHSMVAALMY